MPKNYQITQYDKPSTINGCVDFEFGGGLARVRITRAHLEEDVGKNFHFERISGVDFNRAGVPLMEIVSEPDITSASMAYEYLNALKDILVYGSVSDCDMEKGMVRCDVNVSVRPKGQEELGAKIEIKNMNSFSGVRKALEYEIPRQIEVLKSGGIIVSMLEQPNSELMNQHGVKAISQFTQVIRERLMKLAQWVDQNNIRVNVEKTFSLDEAGKALDYQKNVHPRGKIVLVVSKR